MKKNIIFSVFGNRRSDGEKPESHESQRLMDSIRAFFAIAVPYWKERTSILSWLMLVGIAIFSGLSIYLAKVFNDWYKDFWDCVQKYDLNGFIGMLWLFVFLATLHVCISVYKQYIIAALEIRWRRWLTENYLQRYLKQGAFYKLQLTDQKTDNPDQRISEDLSSFVVLTVNLLIGIVTDICTLITFGIILWGLSKAVEFDVLGHHVYLPDGYLLYLAFGYAVCGTVITFLMGKPLVLLNFRQQRYEADFRFSLIRLRENAESVAIYKGEDEEHKRFSSLFTDVVKNYISLIIKKKQVGYFTLGYAQTAVIFPILIAAPMYFAKTLSMGGLMQILSAFSQVQNSLSTLIDNFSSLAQWKAVIDRLSLFEKSLKSTEKLSELPVSATGSALTIKDVSISKPDGTSLAEHLSFSLEKGKSLLIQGHSGCGKSTLLRTIAGIWPYATGNIVIPEEAKLLFLSQKPYMPLGTLRDAICYPSNGNDLDLGTFDNLLQEVGLCYLKASIDLINQWDHVLSLGEQQRISFLRALIIKPNVLFMDEVTSALDEENETRMYELLKSRLPDTIMISVGHRNTLRAFHDDVLNLEKTI